MGAGAIGASSPVVVVVVIMVAMALVQMLRISSSMFMELKSLSTPSSSPSWQPSSLTTQINAKTIISRVKYARLPRARQSGEKRDYVGKGVPTPPPPLFCWRTMLFFKCGWCSGAYWRESNPFNWRTGLHHALSQKN
jgi:hypothetical protein